jgi:hypothetical protein
LKRLSAQGHLLQKKDGGSYAWQIAPGMRDAPVDNRWQTSVVPDESDRRFRPRIGGIPVNVEAQIFRLAEGMGREFSIDDIIAAWGKLRGEKKRKKGSAAADVRAIILAEDRRRKRAEKRQAHV